MANGKIIKIILGVLLCVVAGAVSAIGGFTFGDVELLTSIFIFVVAGCMAIAGGLYFALVGVEGKI